MPVHDCLLVSLLMRNNANSAVTITNLMQLLKACLHLGAWVLPHAWAPDDACSMKILEHPLPYTFCHLKKNSRHTRVHDTHELGEHLYQAAIHSNSMFGTIVMTAATGDWIRLTNFRLGKSSPMQRLLEARRLRAAEAGSHRLWAESAWF